MKISWRRAIKWTLTALGALSFVVLLQVTSLAFPQSLFSHRLVSKSVIVYSDERFDDALRGMIAGVEERLAAMEIYESRPLQSIYICHNPKLYACFAALSMVPKQTMGFNLSIFENTFISRARIEQVRNANRGNLRHIFLEGNIEQIICHELAHAYTQERLGFRLYRKIPLWKSEGYAEYASTISAIRHDAQDSLLKRIEILLDDSFWGNSENIRNIYRSQLLVEFLAEIRGLNFLEIMSPAVTEKPTLEQMRLFYLFQGQAP